MEGINLNTINTQFGVLQNTSSFSTPSFINGIPANSLLFQNQPTITAENIKTIISPSAISNQQMGQISANSIQAGVLKGVQLAIGNIFTVDNAGNVTAQNITVTGGSISIGNNFYVNNYGQLYGTDATISGSLDIQKGSIVIGSNFSVTNQGDATMSNAVISGTINSATLNSSTIIGGSLNIGSGNFTVASTGAVAVGGNVTTISPTGAFYTSNGDFTGSVTTSNITATGGSISNLTISGTLTGGTINGSTIGSPTINSATINSATINDPNLVSTGTMNFKLTNSGYGWYFNNYAGSNVATLDETGTLTLSNNCEVDGNINTSGTFGSGGAATIAGMAISATQIIWPVSLNNITAAGSSNNFEFSLGSPTGTTASFTWFNAQNALAMSLNNSGDLWVAGTFTAAGTKSAIEKTSAGYKLLYAMEAPEVLYEDVGHGTISNGYKIVPTIVPIDPLFLETVTGDYELFVSPLGLCSYLYAVKSPTSFEVFADANIDFSWRIIFHRRNFETHRMEDADQGVIEMIKSHEDPSFVKK